MQQDNGSKHRSKSTTERLQQKKKQALWRGQVSVLTSSWLRCFGKRAIHTRHHKNIAELKAFCKEEWCWILPVRCAHLIVYYMKCLEEVIAAKRGSTSSRVHITSSTVNVCMVSSVQTWNSIIVWVLRLLLWLFLRVNKILSSIYVEININYKWSLTISYIYWVLFDDYLMKNTVK